MPDLFKDILPSIQVTKKHVFQSEVEYKDYSPFLINRALSYNLDCLFQAQEMNQRWDLSKELQYQFLLNSIAPKKRYGGSWGKKKTSENLKLVMKHFHYSQSKAADALRILTEEQLENIRKIYKDL